MTDVAAGVETSDAEGAALGGIQEGAPATGGAAPEPAGGQASPDFAGLFSQFEERIGTKLGELEQRLPSVPEPETPPDPNDPEAFFGDGDFGDDGSITDEAAERHFMAMVKKTATEEAQRIAKEMVEPLQAERMEERRGQQADALVVKYPELKDEARVNEVLIAAGEFAQRLGLPVDVIDAAATDPAFVELTLLAMKAQEVSDAEGPASTPGVPLETGTGAAPAASVDEPDIGDRLVQRAQAGRFRLG